MNNKKNTVKLRRLKITNFKAIDELEIDFPEPDMEGEPDITVIGSKNGVGKTSVLEACSLLRVFAGIGKKNIKKIDILRTLNINSFQKSIRVGTKCCTIEGRFQINRASQEVSLEIWKDGKILLKNDLKEHKGSRLDLANFADKDAKKLFDSLSGHSLDPLLLPGFLYFPSYRKTEEINPDMETLLGDKDYREERLFSTRLRKMRTASAFKLEVIRAMMGQANLFAGVDSENSQDVLSKLNEFVEEYAGGKIEKLNPARNEYELEISPSGGGNSYSFDGLSSGQKEMISTLFLIWRYYNEAPGIVLIDEPELHLNAEWHRTFINSIVKMAPDNQYIIATHSKTVAASVDSERLVIIEA